jgi:hypothetical protein
MTILPGSGDGLIRPLNAPSGHGVLTGVQPGTSGGVVLAQFVIIFGGTSGGGSAPGMFVYRGSPGPGNPPVYSVSDATEDPYGNAIAPGIWAGQFGGIQAGLDVAPGGNLGQMVLPTGASGEALGGGMAGGLSGGGQSFVQVFGPQGPAPDDDRAIMSFFDSTGGSGAIWAIVYNSLVTSAAITQVQGGFQGVFINGVAGLTAVLPGTGTSTSAPAQPETWHNLTPDAGWAIVDQPQYRLLPGTGVQVRGLITHAATAVQTNINAGVPIPSAYWPAVTRYYRTPMPAPDLAGSVDIQGNGVFVMRASGFAATQAILDGIYAL